MSSGGPFLFPQVTSIPNRSEIDSRSIPVKKDKPGEFDQILDQSLDLRMPNLPEVQAPLRFSAHALQRLKDRNIELNPETMAKISDAVEKASTKGVKESLVLTSDAALIVSVKNKTVVTAMDRNSLNGNIFTNIDGAVVV